MLGFQCWICKGVQELSNIRRFAFSVMSVSDQKNTNNVFLQKSFVCRKTVEKFNWNENRTFLGGRGRVLSRVPILSGCFPANRGYPFKPPVAIPDDFSSAAWTRKGVEIPDRAFLKVLPFNASKIKCIKKIFGCQLT